MAARYVALVPSLQAMDPEPFSNRTWQGLCNGKISTEFSIAMFAYQRVIVTPFFILALINPCYSYGCGYL
jgi:hypothetical protein